MSQNDLVISNQTFPSTRADINDALQALGSLNSGATEPATTYANMMWYDTLNNTLKMRSEANDVWIPVGYLDQSVDAFRIFDNTQVVNTSGTQTGLLGDQSTATWQAGTGTTQSLVSPANVKSAIAALAEGGGTEFISSTVISSGASEVVFTGLSNTLYSEYFFVLSYLLPVTNNGVLTADLSDNNGSTWDTSYYEVGNTSTRNYMSLSDGSSSATYVGNVGLEAGFTGRVALYLSSSNSRRTYVKSSGAWWDGSSTSTLRSFDSAFSSTGFKNYNAIKFYFTLFGGTFESGTISMYGVKKS